MKRYRVTCLTPVLIGDGQKLSPIDYMVWKDQVNVLDQRRIFRLLSKGPRLDSYLTQVKKAQKLDFASWGGFAQNFAGRRIPFAHPDYTAVFNQTPAENCFIPTFAAAAGGMYLPATVLKGALRTGMIVSKLGEPHFKDLEARIKSEHPPRSLAEPIESNLLGQAGSSRTRPLLFNDSQPVPYQDRTKVYLVKTSNLRQAGPRVETSWKPVVTFAEMAAPGTEFTGAWDERFVFHQPDMLRWLHWKETSARRRAVDAANHAADGLLTLQARYAEQARLASVAESIAALRHILEGLTHDGRSCLLCVGWGTGLLAKAAVNDDTRASYHEILRHTVYERAIKTGMPFPKTRKVIFHGQQPWTLPGWIQLDLE
ncbi:MAG: type III-A CRISPR-associated RAMP protein Csm5 [Bryobacterales bacterium]|nr:type III-A CRISPR-associated RAMP protein Csm5 [Bryobacterales bacterium]